MVLQNIKFLLNSFLANSTLENIVFVWVMHQQKIIDDLLSGLHGDYDLYSFSLTASEQELTKRFGKDVEAGIRNQAAIDRIVMYKAVDSIKIDVTGRELPENAERIIKAISENAS